MFDFASTRANAADAHHCDVTSGLLAGTKVAIQSGWRVVEAVTAGDQVLTFDGGLQVVTAVTRHVVQTLGGRADYTDWPLAVPAGALGNRADMVLLPQQAVLVESDTAEAVFGDPFAMIPAAALDGFRGIYRRAPAEQIEVVTLQFAQDEVVFANIGALFFCPAATDLLAAPTDDSYHLLETAQAELLVRYLELEDRGIAAGQQARAAFRDAA